MKKKYRIITVNNILYTWAYFPNNDDGGGELKIWKNKKIIHNSQIDYNINITPSHIAELITATEF